MRTKVTRALLGDIGGTHARFALLDDESIGPIDRLDVADHPGVSQAIAHFLAAHDARAEEAVLAVAGVVDGNRCTLANSPWMIDADVLQQEFGFEAVHLINDFEALAWSVPHLTPDDLFLLRAGRVIAGAPRLVIGPGTGFGVSCLLTDGNSSLVLASEAAHSTLSAASPREAEVIDHLRAQFGHVSIERAVSGPGLENLYSALAAINSRSVPPRKAQEITAAALADACAVSRSALDMFCAMLGTVAGNLALTFCARGGIYIGGGIVPQFPRYLAASEFRAQSEAKGRFRAYLREIPIHLITDVHATFKGLKAAYQLAGDRQVGRAGAA